MELNNSFKDKLSAYLAQRSYIVVTENKFETVVNLEDLNVEFGVNRVFGHLDVMLWSEKIAKKFTVENSADYNDLIHYMEHV